MSRAPQFRSRRRARWKWWLAFAALALVYGAIQLGLDAACRHEQARRISQDAIARKLENVIRWNYPSHDLIPQMETDLNGGRPLPRQRIELPSGWFDRVIVNGSAIDPAAAGWHVQIDYSATPATFWTHIRAVPPPSGSRLLETLGSSQVPHPLEQLRILMLIVCASVWVIIIAPAMVAGPYRRELGQIAMAASILAILAWSACPERPRIASLPPLDWIGFTALGGLVTGLITALLPVRSSRRRPDRCAACNYDLTGNVSGICPECGQPTPAEARRRRDQELAPLADAVASIEAPPPDPAEEEAPASAHADHAYPIPR